MARHEQDREDLLREATALITRAELQIPDEPAPVTIGFRRDGAASFYFGADFVLQFNSRGEFRRGYDGGRLLKTEGRTLIWITRQRNTAAVVLSSRPATAEEEATFRRHATERLHRVATAIAENHVQVIGQVPADLDLRPRIREWLSRLAVPFPLADQPRVN